MTNAVERTQALLWGGAFLIEVARNKDLPLEIRRQATNIARHFPTIEDVESMALTQNGDPSGLEMASAEELLPATPMGRFGPLRWNTRLGWPE